MFKRIVFVVICYFFLEQLSSQNFSPYFTGGQYQKYIEYLINNGRLDVNHPLNQPYTTNEILVHLPVADSQYDNHWLSLMKKDLYKMSSINDSLYKNGKLITGISVGDKYSLNETDSSNYLFGNILIGYNYRNFGLIYKT
ncbi:MAG: hypothetical protein R2759_21085 [Bacteroidales bacterium]